MSATKQTQKGINMTIAPSHLYKLRGNLPREEAVCARRAGIQPDVTYWLITNRRSSLGGYLGHFQSTYSHSLGVSPTGTTVCKNLPMRYMENFGLSTD